MFLGAIKAGLVPVAVNTLLTGDDFDFMLRDSRAQALIVSEALLPVFKPILGDQPFLKHIVVAGTNSSAHPRLSDLMASAPTDFAVAPTRPDDDCFWLYSSGSTGTPKGVVHVQTSLMRTAELYAQPILGIEENDVVFSAAKLFFAYGLGNALTFPLSVGATTVLLSDRPTPQAVCRVLREHRPTIFMVCRRFIARFYRVPICRNARSSTCAAAPRRAKPCRPRSEGAGANTPASIFSTVWARPKCFTSSCPTARATCATAPPEKQCRVIKSVWSMKTASLCRKVKSASFKSTVRPARRITGTTGKRAATLFSVPGLRSGDKYSESDDGYFTYSGRNDDMLKVSGIWVSPFEVESTLASHAAVLEAAVVGQADESGLIKPKAYVVLRPDTRNRRRLPPIFNNT